jgi:cell division protein FtsL
MAPAAATKPRASKTAASREVAPTRAERNQRALANARATQRAGTAAPARTAPSRRKSGAVAAPTRGKSSAATAAPARRKSGAAATPAPARRRPAAAPRKAAASPVARVLNSRGMPLVDRVLRGPVWVVMLGVLLAGIVFLNVSVLELNRGIARTDAKAAQLERTNSGLRERVAKLDSGERIQELAAARGFVMPQPGEVTFVRPHRSDAKLAAERITAPDESTLDPTATPTAQTGYTTGAEPAGTGVEPTATTVAPTGTTTTDTATTVAAPTAATTQQVP